MHKAQDIEELVKHLEAIKKVASSYGQSLRSHFGPRLKRVRLFGSGARGDWTPESDVDILVLLDRATSSDMDFIFLTAVTMGSLESGYLLQPVVMNESAFIDLLKRERRFARDIEKEGIEL